VRAPALPLFILLVCAKLLVVVDGISPFPVAAFEVSLFFFFPRFPPCWISLIYALHYLFFYCFCFSFLHTQITTRAQTHKHDTLLWHLSCLRV
jgi:hypothetical protein